MPTSSKAIADLEALARDAVLVDLDTGGPYLTGAILDVGPDSLLVHRFDDESMKFTGWSLILLEALNRYRPNTSFVSEFVKAKRLRPKIPREADLTSLSSTLQWLQSSWPVVIVHRQVRFPDEVQVGSIAALTSKTMTLDLIDTDAQWSGSYRIRLNEITRIDFGGHYEDALIEMSTSRA
jgi:hypothetical protein